EFTAASSGTVEIDAWHVYFLDLEPPAASRYWFGYFDGDTESSAGGAKFAWSGAQGSSPSTGVNVLTETRPTFRFRYTGDLLKAADRTIIEQFVGEWRQVHDSGWVLRDTTITEPPIGLLKNEAHYRVKIAVRDTNGITNESQYAEFETKFRGPSELIVRTVGQDDRRAILTISWEPSTLPAVEFVAYEVSVYSLQEGDLRVARITDPATSSYEYPFPVSGRQYRVRVRQIQAVGPDEIASRWAGNETSVEYERWFIKDLAEPVVKSLAFPVYAGDEPQTTRKANHSVFRPQGRRVPVHYLGEERSLEGSLTIRFEVDDETAAEDQRMLYDLIESRTVCILGLDPGSKTFAYLDDPSETLPDLPWLAVYEVPYQETYYVEDVFLRLIERG
ncbi:MAG: fibronectin type III domain-containing protein, partial [Actinomycetota bacterium]|nr:fibronectin type III domain-containing protein [Actinomycetota bacterium]